MSAIIREWWDKNKEEINNNWRGIRVPRCTSVNVPIWNAYGVVIMEYNFRTKEVFIDRTKVDCYL